MEQKTESGSDSELETVAGHSEPKAVLPTSTISRDLDRRYYQKGTRWLMGSAGFLVLAIGGWFAYRHWTGQSSSQGMAVTVVEVKRDRVEITISASGTIELGGQQILKAPKEVTVEAVNVKAGDRVRKGQILILLRDVDSKTAFSTQSVENAKFALEVVRRREKVAEHQKQREAEMGIIQRELTRSEEKVTEKMESVESAKARLQDTRALFERGLVSKDELGEDESKVETAISELKDARLELAKAQKTAQDRQAKVDSDLQDLQLELQKAELDLKNGQSRLQDIQQKLSYQAVVAPIDGTILDVAVQNGDGVKNEGPLVTLGDPRQQVANLKLTTLEAAKVKLNQVARISNIGPNPQVFTGRVVAISPQASAEDSGGSEGGGRSSAKVDAQVLLDRATRTLIPGSRVSVLVVIEERRNAIAVPTEVIQREGDQAFVWIKDAQSKAQKRPVKLGLQSTTQTEVLVGLREGETLVMTNPEQTLTPGMSLKVQAES